MLPCAPWRIRARQEPAHSSNKVGLNTKIEIDKKAATCQVVIACDFCSDRGSCSGRSNATRVVIQSRENAPSVLRVRQSPRIART